MRPGSRGGFGAGPGTAAGTKKSSVEAIFSVFVFY